MIAEFPLFIFTLFAGLAAGTYAMAAVFPISTDAKGQASQSKGEGMQNKGRSWLFPLIMLVLLGIGLVGCLGHLHRPERFLNALWNPLAGITQEAYLSMLFGIMLVIDLIISAIKGSCPRPIRIVGAVFGILLAFVMGYAYFGTLGVEPWGTPFTILMFLVGDLAMGAAFWALWNKGIYENKAYWYTTILVEAVFAFTLIGMGVTFSSFGLSVLPFVVAVVIAPVAHIVLVCVKGISNKSWTSAAAFACVMVGLVIARYAFYAIA